MKQYDKQREKQSWLKESVIEHWKLVEEEYEDRSVDDYYRSDSREMKGKGGNHLQSCIGIEKSVHMLMLCVAQSLSTLLHPALVTMCEFLLNLLIKLYKMTIKCAKYLIQYRIKYIPTSFHKTLSFIASILSPKIQDFLGKVVTKVEWTILILSLFLTVCLSACMYL